MRRFWILCLLLCGSLLPCPALGEAFPSFWINTQNAAPVESKEEYFYCVVSVGGLSRAPAQVRGHGYSTWSQGEKKSYRIKFGKKQRPLGIGERKERDWILLSNQFDKSLLRNFTAFTLASRLDGLDAAVRFQYTHLYLNGDYRGLYMLCERVEPNSCGLDINEAEGFLVKMDIHSIGENAFQIGDKTYAVKSDYVSQDQFDQIYSDIDEVDSAIMLEDEEAVREALDIPSWVDAYIVEEFMMDTDVGFGSFYFYRPDADSKLFAGPLWDFDLSAGNCVDTHWGLYEGFYASAINGTPSDHQWFAWLMDTEWFSAAVRERWREVSPLVDEVIREVEAVAQLYAQDFNLNFERWPVLGDRLWREPDELLTLGSQGEHAAYLVRWLQGRKSWLDEAWE